MPRKKGMMPSLFEKSYEGIHCSLYHGCEVKTLLPNDGVAPNQYCWTHLKFQKFEFKLSLSLFYNHHNRTRMSTCTRTSIVHLLTFIAFFGGLGTLPTAFLL